MVRRRSRKPLGESPCGFESHSFRKINKLKITTILIIVITLLISSLSFSNQKQNIDYYKNFIENNLKGNELLESIKEKNIFISKIMKDIVFFNSNYHNKLKIIPINPKKKKRFLFLHCNNKGIILKDSFISKNKKKIENTFKNKIKALQNLNYNIKALCKDKIITKKIRELKLNPLYLEAYTKGFIEINGKSKKKYIYIIPDIHNSTHLALNQYYIIDRLIKKHGKNRIALYKEGAYGSIKLNKHLRNSKLKKRKKLSKALIKSLYWDSIEAILFTYPTIRGFGIENEKYYNIIYKAYDRMLETPEELKLYNEAEKERHNSIIENLINEINIQNEDIAIILLGYKHIFNNNNILDHQKWIKKLNKDFNKIILYPFHISNYNNVEEPQYYYHYDLSDYFIKLYLEKKTIVFNLLKKRFKLDFIDIIFQINDIIFAQAENKDNTDKTNKKDTSGSFKRKTRPIFNENNKLISIDKKEYDIIKNSCIERIKLLNQINKIFNNYGFYKYYLSTSLHNKKTKIKLTNKISKKTSHILIVFNNREYSFYSNLYKNFQVYHDYLTGFFDENAIVEYEMGLLTKTSSYLILGYNIKLDNWINSNFPNTKLKKRKTRKILLKTQDITSYDDKGIEIYLDYRNPIWITSYFSLFNIIEGRQGISRYNITKHFKDFLYHSYIKRIYISDFTTPAYIEDRILYLPLITSKEELQQLSKSLKSINDDYIEYILEKKKYIMFDENNLFIKNKKRLYIMYGFSKNFYNKKIINDLRNINNIDIENEMEIYY